MLEIKGLYAQIEEKEILKGLDLQVNAGEIHALMGPNGAGKSTLAKVLAGHPSYEVEGSIRLAGEEIVEMEPAERAKLGLFMSFQYPLEIAGLSNFQFLYHAYQSLYGKCEEGKFKERVEKCAAEMKMDVSFLGRDLNSGFSGGEKKRNEILQLLTLDPKVAILDETDSGLDIDALHVVADGVNRWMREDRGLILITHYQRLLDDIQPDFVHIVADGKIVRSGTAELAKELEAVGYDQLLAECPA